MIKVKPDVKYEIVKAMEYFISGFLCLCEKMPDEIGHSETGRNKWQRISGWILIS